ncbi:glutamate--tRNA ligase [Limibacillus halophilus]|uniref:Glutamate--tRNA ligase n=1 Tax=Limibacillus halophilus TaxID=1579333 RepID=A0A839SSV8_9PROT|nr:glutamate--tRNA ligase [Limibacillus halophilus]MBB3065891.1 glutamyl-tRNA synthetase [Limibacillus halophilus]
MTIVTRFAPSPTGFLHIGGARTALFNWLYARHHGGTFRLRIEDTDRQRSTPEAIAAILEGLQWLGLDWDEDVVYQFERAGRHAAVVEELLAKGLAYRCYASPEELDAMRSEQRAKGLPVRYDGRWRDRDPADAPAGVQPVIRLKAPQEGETVIEDHVQGAVTVMNAQLDDMVMLRADGTPTYMLSVVVDDHDMGITHVIRGDDHLTNAFRQTQLYRAMGWQVPAFAHIPLIHGPDGAKLSKRHGALGVEAYRDLGYLPEAMRNYLLRLGWGHGDDEIITTEQAVAWFELGAVGRSASRFDFAKLDSLNAHYLKNSDDHRLVSLIAPRLEKTLGATLSQDDNERLIKGMNGLKQRAKNLNHLAETALFYVKRPDSLSQKAGKILDHQGKSTIEELLPLLEDLKAWSEEACESTVKAYADSHDMKLGNVAQPLRAALTGTNVSPGIFEVMAILGRDETLLRLREIPTIVLADERAVN